jgi:hydroxyethylthiazole kinase-like uncharacterized protein yjeF
LNKGNKGNEDKKGVLDQDSYLSRSELREIDRRANADFCIPTLLLMETAGLNLSVVVREILSEIEAETELKKVVIVCGRGNNGGDGLVLARQLHLAAYQPKVLFIDTRGQGPRTADCRVNMDIVKSMGIPLKTIQTTAELDSELSQTAISCLVDAYLGTGIETYLRVEALGMIEGMNRFPGLRLSVDIPSGLDCDRGQPLGAAVRADYTVTMAALKRGFLNDQAQAYIGRVELVSIGAPPELLPTNAPRDPRRFRAQ